jgi:predicted DNA-binding antitoxin AbrB/MazE fold protein
MIEVIEATFQDGVFKPDRQPALSESTRVRLIVEAAGEQGDEFLRKQSWDNLEQIWQTSQLDSLGDRLSRDQLHERR